MTDHGIGMAEALLGLDGFRMLEVIEGDDELIVRVETTPDVVVCDGCGEGAEAQDRVDRTFRDLPCFGRSVRLEWRKRSDGAPVVGPAVMGVRAGRLPWCRLS